MALVGGIAESHQVAQPQRRGQGVQLRQRRAVDGTHDAAAHPVGPGGGGHAAQRQTQVHVGAAGQGGVPADCHKQGGALLRFGGALLRRQVGGPVHQRVGLFHHLGRANGQVFQRLAVGAAAGNAGGLQQVGQGGVGHRLRREAAVGAAGGKELHQFLGRHGGPSFAIQAGNGDDTAGPAAVNRAGRCGWRLAGRGTRRRAYRCRCP